MMEEMDAVRGFRALGGQNCNEEEKLRVFMAIFHPKKKKPTTKGEE